MGVFLVRSDWLGFDVHRSSAFGVFDLSGLNPFLLMIGLGLGAGLFVLGLILAPGRDP
jgi:hypothetical protein